MVLFPNAKINIGLEVLRKRPDNFHDLETVFYPIKLCDILEITQVGKFAFSSSGLSVGDCENDNLVVKAYSLLKERYNLSPVKIHLHKIIPTGAGLGGGSSDAAYTLIALNKLFNLNLSNRELTELSLVLGSDCAFFIRNEPVFAQGRGNIFSDIQVNLSTYKIIVLKPSCSVSTASAYKNIQPEAAGISLPDIIKENPDVWKGKVVNRFEETVFPSYPEVGNIKQKLYEQGALYASMSGSGSAVFGIFKKNAGNFKEQFPGCFYWEE
ncbi:MAG: 4-(cytidine 5'-diphospho)-2-C-methyl-D-erythritol kinase [Prolixibacteraceae bacterium]|nr:4-(cytidine 5'-diphospho)-2-C-methyl-D-erythritol kinase [Prolixibacteraceae bacterium]